MKRMLCGFLAVLLAAAVLSAGAEAKEKTDPVEWYTDFRCMLQVMKIKEGPVVVEDQYNADKKNWLIKWQEFEGFTVLLTGDAQDNLQTAVIASKALDDAQLTAGTNNDDVFCMACTFAALSTYGPFDKNTLNDCYATMNRAMAACLAQDGESFGFTWEGILISMTCKLDTHIWIMFLFMDI